jgi:hypothetical protein
MPDATDGPFIEDFLSIMTVRSKSASAESFLKVEIHAVVAEACARKSE